MQKGLSYAARISVYTEGEAAALLAQDDRVFLSYHWYNGDKSVYQWDYPRFHSFAIREGCFHTIIPVEIPAREGVYYFQADIVQEGVRWFYSSGLLESPLIEVSVTVGGGGE